jgi:hypothetical protein
MNRKEITIIALIILLSVVAWISYDIYYTRNKTTISPKELQQVIPLTPTFDNDILKGLKAREE